MINAAESHSVDECRPVRPRNIDEPFDDAFYTDPNAVLAWFRKYRPVPRVRLPNGLSCWLVTRYDDVRLVLADPRFASDTRQYPQAWEQVDWRSASTDMLAAFGRNLSSSDPPEHGWLKAPIAAFFTPARAKARAPRIREVAELFLGAIPSGERIDLIAEYTVPVAVTVMCETYGIPECDRGTFLEFMRRAVSLDAKQDETLLRAAAHNCAELLTAYVNRRIPTQEDGLITSVSEILKRDGGLTEDIVTLLIHAFIAGTDTTATLTGTAVLGLLLRPELAAAVQSERSSIPAVVEEFLRFDGPARLGQWRFSSEEVTVGGQRIPAGELVIVALGSANRDPDHFAEPDRFSLDREKTAHLGFGGGKHYCTGAALGRVGAQTALDVIIGRMSDLRLAVPPEALVLRPTFTLNGLRELPVIFDSPSTGDQS
ncbi:cytochrome P450 [Amycolatopsis sp. NPDC049868]|uniref:cytochrome P450 n=1 Tax=Amycolatopsis sp. NPDC049868 TaxID=3363934 RepID=UPI0037A67CCC